MVADLLQRHDPARPLETPYPLRTYTPTDFTDPDTDGDGIPDGADDEDHDGFTNATEVSRAADPADRLHLDRHAGSDTAARVNPFNPCKPFYSTPATSTRRSGPTPTPRTGPAPHADGPWPPPAGR